MTENRIKGERVNARLMQPDLAEKMGVTAQTISNWESGKIDPAGRKWAELSKEFGCSVDYLMGLTEERM